MVVACEHCGVKLSENSMKFHRQVCGSVQKPQCVHCGRRFDADALAVHENICGDRSAPAPRQQSPPATTAAAQNRPLSPTAADRGAMPNIQPRDRRQVEQVRRNLTQLREEVYGKGRAPESASEDGSTLIPHDSLRDDTDERANNRRQRRTGSLLQPTAVPRTPSTADEDASGYDSRGRTGRGAARRPLEHGGASDMEITREVARGAPQYPGPHQADSARESPLQSRAFAELRGQVVDQEERLRRMESLVDRIQREVTQMNREQRDLHDDLRDLAKRTVGRSASSDVATASELRTDLHNLGRHVDVLRDEVETMRTETQQHRRKIEEQLNGAAQRSEDVATRLRDVETAVESVQTDKSGQNANDQHRRKYDEVSHEMRELGRQVADLQREFERQRKDRDAAVGIKKDVKHIGRDVDTLHDELRQLRRQVDNDQRRIENAVARSGGEQARLPSRTPSRRPRSIDVSPGASPEDHIVIGGAGGAGHASARHHRHAPEHDEHVAAPPATYVVGYTDDLPAPRVAPSSRAAHTDTDTESIVARAVHSGSARRAPQARGLYSASYSSSRASSVSSATAAATAPVAHVSLTPRHAAATYRRH
jgi:hypothetical protein